MITRVELIQGSGAQDLIYKVLEQIQREPAKMAAILDYNLRGLQQSAAALQTALDAAQTAKE